jgi:tetratricopeptide (TPR) repeat protein
MHQKKLGGELLVFFILWCSTIQAQQSSIDSLTRLLPSLNDTNRIGALTTIAYKYLAFNPSKAKEIASEALALSKQKKFAKGEVGALLNLGDYEFRQSNYAKSLEYGTQAIRVASQISDSSAMADAYRLMGNVHTFGFRQYDEALTYQLKALAIIKKGNDKRKLAALYGSLTWVYSVTNKNLDTANLLAREGIKIGKSLNDHQLISYNLNSLGLINYRKQNFDSALYYLNNSNKEGAMVNDEAVQTVNNLTIATIYLAQQKVDQAIQLFKEVFKKGAQINLREIEKDAYEGLSKSYKAKQDFKLALTYHLKFVQLRDSLLNWEITQKSLALKATFDEERREAKISELQYEKEKANSERNLVFFISIATIALLLTVVALTIRNSNQKRKANKQLFILFL